MSVEPSGEGWPRRVGVGGRGDGSESSSEERRSTGVATLTPTAQLTLVIEEPFGPTPSGIASARTRDTAVAPVASSGSPHTVRSIMASRRPRPTMLT